MSDEVPNIEELLADGHKAMTAMADDIGVFDELTLQQKIRMHARVKHTKPMPEMKEDHGWLVSYMKENIEATEADEAEEAIRKITAARNADELGKAAREAVEALTMPPEPEPVNIVPGFEEDPAPTIKADQVEEFVVEEPEPEEEIEHVNEGNATIIQTAPVEIPPMHPVAERLVHVVASEPAMRLASASCILAFYQSEPTFKKKVSADSISSMQLLADGMDPQRLSVSKALIETRELNELLMHRRRFNRELKHIILPGGRLTLAGGQYLLPYAMVPRAKAMIDEYISTRETLLNRFEENYPAIIERAKIKLGGHFDELDYPPFERIREAYSVNYRFIPNRVPEELKAISDEFYQAEEERIIIDAGLAFIDIEKALRLRFFECVDHFGDRLGNDEKTGRPKQLHGSVVEKVQEFVHDWPSMDLTGDEELNQLVREVGSLIGNSDADRFRGDSEFRDKMKVAFDSIRHAARSLVYGNKSSS